MIDHVIFDLDGTLIDSAAVCVDIVNEMLRERGCRRVLTTRESKGYMSLGGTQMISALLGAECGDPVREIADFRERYHTRPTPLDSPFEGVKAGLMELASLGFGLAICSNKPQTLCEKVLAETHFAPFFSTVVGGAPGRRPKPSTDLMDLTLAQLDTTPERCVFIGDSELDHAVADATGVPFLFVTYGYAEPGWATDDIVKFDQFGDVVRAVAQFKEPIQRRMATRF
jgi:phosphoglycolate phosphatase